MTGKILQPIKLLLFSSLFCVVATFIVSFLLTDLQLLQVANILFWVGALTVVIGGCFFISIHNKYHAQSVAIMTTLKHHVPDDKHSLKAKEKRKSSRIVNGLAIATPGAIMMIISWLIFASG